MTRSRSSPEALICTSWLVYASRTSDRRAKQIKNLVLAIKGDRFDANSGRPVAQLVIERAAATLGPAARGPFDGHPMLVPVPRSVLMKPHTVWPAHRICEELVRLGFGDDLLPVVRRTTAVIKSAGSSERPTLEQHLRSLTVQRALLPPSRLLVVDDVVTSGTTMMACAQKLGEAFPGVPVAGFSLARVLSAGEPEAVLTPLTERIIENGQRCARRPF